MRVAMRRFDSSRTCAYVFMVMPIELCPSSSMTSRPEAPSLAEQQRCAGVAEVVHPCVRHARPRQQPVEGNVHRPGLHRPTARGDEDQVARLARDGALARIGPLGADGRLLPESCEADRGQREYPSRSGTLGLAEHKLTVGLLQGAPDAQQEVGPVGGETLTIGEPTAEGPAYAVGPRTGPTKRRADAPLFPAMGGLIRITVAGPT